jgi:hypothetical protein
MGGAGTQGGGPAGCSTPGKKIVEIGGTFDTITITFFLSRQILRNNYSQTRL